MKSLSTATLKSLSKCHSGMTLPISEKIEGKWAVLPKRWVVDRTFSWLSNFRRLSKDFEILPATAENMIRIAMLKLTLAKCI